MKTPTFIPRLIYALLFSVLISINFGCAAFMDAEINGQQSIPFTKEGLIDLNKLAEWAEADQKLIEQRFYPNQYVEGSAGFGLNSSDDETETSFCLGAGYNYRVSEDNYNNSSYVGAFASQHISSADERKFNKTQVGLQYTRFDRLTKNAEVDLTYALRASYEKGTFENFGFENDFNGYEASLLIGAGFNVTDNVSVAITAPLITHNQRTIESDGGDDIDQSNTWLGLNKDNMVMAYVRIGLGK